MRFLGIQEGTAQGRHGGTGAALLHPRKRELNLKKQYLLCFLAPRGEVFVCASRHVRGREARRGLQPGDVRRSLRQRVEVFSPGTCKVIFGARQRVRARRRMICSPARCSACRRGRRRGGLQVPRCISAWAKARWPETPGPASWRCLPRRVPAWAKALSTSGGLGRYWAAQWHLARAVGKRFRGAAQSASMLV